MAASSGDAPAPSPGASDFTLQHQPASSRFAVQDRASGKQVAYVEYAATGMQCSGPGACKGTLDLYHTWTDPAQRGKGLAALVVGAAFQHAEETGMKIVPSCSYISGAFLSKRPHLRSLCVTQGAGFREAEPLDLSGPPDAGAERDTEADAAAHANHMFNLAYTQYSKGVGLKALVSDDAFRAGVQGASDLRTLSRFGCFLVGRGQDLEAGAEAAPPALPAAAPPSSGQERAGKARRRAGGDATTAAAQDAATAVPGAALSAKQCFGRGAQCLYRCWELDTSGGWLNPRSDAALEACVARGYDVGVTHASAE